MTKSRSKHTGSTRVDATPTDDFIGRCPTCRLPTRVTIADERRDHCVITCLHCADDKPQIDAQRLYGVESTDSCDVMCMSAMGRMCVCACGGRNHGKIWGNTRKSEATAAAIEKFYAREKMRFERKERKERESREERERTFAQWYESLSTDERRVVDFIVKYDNLDSYGLHSTFMLDMRLQIVDSHPYVDEDVVIKSRPLSEKQLAAVVRSVEREWSFIARNIEERANAKSVVEGRYELTGTIISAKVVPGFDRLNFKILIAVNGYKIWGNCPKNVIDDVFISTAQNYRAYTGPTGYDFKVGLRIKMTASVRKSERDETFGLFKIAKNAVILNDAESDTDEIVSEPSTVVETETESAPEASTELPASPTPSATVRRTSSHSECAHENTKSARAKCRRERSK